MKEHFDTKGRCVHLESNLKSNHRLVIGDALLKQWVEVHGHRVRCRIEGHESFSAPLLHDGDGGFFITLNAKLLARLNLQEEQWVALQLSPERSTYGTPVSEVFLATMKDDPKADKIFHALTPGKQRTLIHWVDQVSSTDIRIRRSLVVMDHLKEGEGQLDFKRLNARMKEVNALYKKQ